MIKKQKVFIIVTEHFDLMWRRCFDRDIEFNGQNYVSYSDLEAYYIIDNIELCRKYDFYKFEIESVDVLKKFLEKYPQYDDEIKLLINNGQLYIAMSGNNIIDSNMVWGESIIRNYLYGQNYLKNNYNLLPQGMDRNDAFGNSAQLPQIARGFDTKWVYHISYSFCDKPYWRGLDGSIVYNFDPPTCGSVGAYYKYRPCPVCNGYKNEHCAVCNDRRIDVDYAETVRNHDYPDKIKINTDIPAYIYVGGEEILPIEEPIKWAIDNKDKYDIEFINFEDYIPYFKDKLDRIDDISENELHPSPELNVNNTGCYVSRIKVKQINRLLENTIQKAEGLSLQGYLQGEKYPYNELEEIWNKQLFLDFHDALPATHVDAAYDELMDIAKEEIELCKELCKKSENALLINNDDIVTVFNPYGIKINTTASICIKCNDSIYLKDENNEKVVISSYERIDDLIKIEFAVKNIAPFSKKTYKIIHTSTEQEILTTPVFNKIATQADIIFTNKSKNNNETTDNKLEAIENDYYKITADSQGITEIFDKKQNKIFSSTGEYRVGEWILEHDEGSPWATLSNDMRRKKLSNYTHLTKVKKYDDLELIEFNIIPDERASYAIDGLYISYSVILEKDCDLIKFKANVDWDAQNHRLRIAFPVNESGKHFYEIPYGMLERKPYEPNCVSDDGESNWASAAGDYPAINWAGIQTVNGSVALFNKGTPSYQINKDNTDKENIYLSVLRSPSVGTYLHEPRQYSMTAYDGMRDVGKHSFEYALKSYDSDFSKNSAVADGIGFNAQMSAIQGDLKTVALPEIIGDNVCISSCKCAENKKGFILRLVEYHGIDSKISIKLPDEMANIHVYETNMQEIPQKELNISENKISLDIGHFKIKTLYFEMI